MTKKKIPTQSGLDLFAGGPAANFGDVPPYDKRVWEPCDHRAPDCGWWCWVDGVAFAIRPIDPANDPELRLAGKQTYHIHRPTNRTDKCWTYWQKQIEERMAAAADQK